MDYFRIVLVLLCAILGAVFGSFACCQAWRIRLKEEKRKDPGKRSVCLSCGKQLKWFENVPILSWILLKGKCRKCGARIGRAEILAEVFGLVSFGLIAWKFVSMVPMEIVDVAEFVGTLDIVRMVVAMAGMVGLILLAVYDGKWGEMPVGILVYTIVIGVVYAILTVLKTGMVMEYVQTCPEEVMCVTGGEMRNVLDFNAIWNILGSVGILAGIYYLLYFFSREKLVGGGDWMLCFAIGLFLADWRLALLELFLANSLGAIFMLPKKRRKTPFGPFLVIAFIVIFAFERVILDVLAINL